MSEMEGASLTRRLLQANRWSSLLRRPPSEKLVDGLAVGELRRARGWSRTACSAVERVWQRAAALLELAEGHLHRLGEVRAERGELVGPRPAGADQVVDPALSRRDDVRLLIGERREDRLAIVDRGLSRQHIPRASTRSSIEAPGERRLVVPEVILQEDRGPAASSSAASRGGPGLVAIVVICASNVNDPPTTRARCCRPRVRRYPEKRH